MFCNCYCIGSLKLLHATCIFIHKKLNFRKYLVMKICMLSLIFNTSFYYFWACLSPQSRSCGSSEMSSRFEKGSHLIVCGRNAPTWFANNLLQRLTGKTVVWCAKAVLSHDHRNLRYHLKEAFTALGWSVSASGICFSIAELLFEPPAPSSSAAVIAKWGKM